MRGRRVDRTGRSMGKDRYVALHHWMMRTPAWRSLDAVSRCAYIELSARYAGPGSNNGRIPCSVREISDALHVSKMTACRAFKRLQERGFIIEVRRGSFDHKLRHATEWRLTEFADDVTGEMATKDFARWQDENQNAVSPGNPNGFRHDTVRVST
jgi:DNA-binding transcriptional regulator YhcF (GntR family)